MRDPRSVHRLRARLSWLAALMLLAPLIAACEITFDPGGGSGGGFAVTNASLRTDHRATVNGAETYVICDDRRTELSYRIDYRGSLASWRSYLEGVTSGDVAGDITLTRGDSEVEIIDSNSVRVTYILPSGSAPLLQGPTGDAPGATDEGAGEGGSDIVVVPNPQIIGYTRLYLEVQGYDPFRFPSALSSGRIPVIDNCDAAEPAFEITNASLQTDYRATVDGAESYIICDDRRTELSYRFDYRGSLASWRSYLEGVTSGDVAGDVTLGPGDSRVQTVDADTVRVTYVLPSGTAPLLQVPDASEGSDIVVVPTPRVVGYTRLYLQVQGEDRFRVPATLSSDRIPVIDNCTG